MQTLLDLRHGLRLGKEQSLAEHQIAPHDGSNAATWSYDATAQTLTLTGLGSYVGIPKAVTGGELSNGATLRIKRPMMLHQQQQTELVLDISTGRWLLEIRTTQH